VEEFETGSVIARKYRVIARIGSGAAGAVYEVEPLAGDAPGRLALKRLKSEVDDDRAARARLVDEAERLGGLLHPNVARVYDVDHDPVLGVFIVMERVDRASLSDVVREGGPLPYREAIRVGMEIASVLESLHDKGVVHGNIKPQNILIEAGTGRTVLTDFGMARKIREGDDTDETRVGFFVGTQRYASPPQMRNERPTSACEPIGRRAACGRGRRGNIIAS
jgi:eukaryotic-like serine/threonine-protein kinase